MLFPFATLILAVTVAAAPLEKRATTLADGNGYKTGALTNSLWWQSSGKLIQGNCPGNVQIGNCFQVLLKASGNLEKRREGEASDSETALDLSDAYNAESTPFLAPRDIGGVEYEEAEVSEQVEGSSALVKRASPRQRIEMYSMPMAASGQKWSFTWRSYLAPGTSTSGTFFHLFQLLRRDASGGPIITLDAKNGKAVVMDPIRGCTSCASVPISSFTGRTVQHTLIVKFGSAGTLNYVAKDVSNGKQLLSYSAKGQMGSSASIKAGAYRAVANGMSAVTSYVGDFNFRQQ